MKLIDFFSGIGGFTLGASQAGAQVVCAANHWPLACEMHARNHPEAEHRCQDLQQINMHDLPDNDGLVASPACQGHTHARGKERPQHDVYRATAWAVVAYAEAWKKPLSVENVVEFLDWKLYPAWKAGLEALGYCVSPHIIDAADHGVAQHRKRVFISCTRSRHPLKLDLPKRPYVPAEQILDLQSKGWSSLRSKCPNTRARARAGRKAFGSRFVMPYYGSGSGTTGRSLARPLGTITTKDRWALVEGNYMRMLSVAEYRRGMGFPDDYALPVNSTDAKKMLGNAVCPPAACDYLKAWMATL